MSQQIMTDNTDSGIENFFHGRHDSLQLFNQIRKLVESKYSVKIEVSKTQISFREQYKYAWVWLPQTWIEKRNQNSITLSIVTGKKPDSKRIEESVEPRKGYWTSHIIIDKSSDIDKEIEDLIEESYDFYLQRLENERKQRTGKKPSFNKH